MSVGATTVRLVLLAGLTGLAGGLAAGCGDDEPTKSEPTVQTAALPALGEGRVPASAAGGSCQLLDFYAVEQLIGVRFEVAASAQRDTTATCVLQKSGVGYPDLTLSVTPTALVAAAFKATVAPAGAADLAGVGAAAYQVVQPAVGTDPTAPGPSAEIGWLTRDNQLMVVRYRLPSDKPASEATAAVPRLTELAKFLDPA